MRAKTTAENGFKETEIGLVPDDWEMLELEGNIDLQTGKRMKGGALGKGEVPSIGGEHLNVEGRILWDKMKFISEGFYTSLKQGKVYETDILVVKDGATTGKVAFASKLPSSKIAVNEHVFIVRSTNDKLLNRFLYFYLFSNLGQYQLRLNYHGIIGGIKREDVNTIVIPLPPLPEQQKISFVLSKVQQAIEEQDKIIQISKELKKSLMNKLFSEGLHGEEQKETEIGLIPKSWDVVRLGDGSILEMVQYGISVRGEPTGQYPILRMNCLINGYVANEKLQFVNIDKRLFDKFKLVEGDILFNRTNSIDLVGKTGIFNLKGEYTFASYLIRLKTNKEKLDPGFLNLYLNLDTSQERLKTLATRGVSQSNISGSRLKTFSMPLPPELTKQKEICNIVSSIDKKLSQAESRKQTLQALFTTMLNQLMTGRIRVKNLDIKVN